MKYTSHPAPALTRASTIVDFDRDLEHLSSLLCQEVGGRSADQGLYSFYDQSNDRKKEPAQNRADGWRHRGAARAASFR